MKTQVLSLLFTICFIPASFAQDVESPSPSTALGFQLMQYQRDFGIGLNLTSPFFANDAIAFRVRGNLVWNEHLDTTGSTTWTPYSNFSIGVVSVGGFIGNSIRLYGEGGMIVLFPSSEFSSKSSDFGGYGLFGFEFFMDPQHTYFLEVGGVGTGATADKVPGQPIYSNGLTISVGYRFVFKGDRSE